MRVESVSKGKTRNRNEDYFDYHETCFTIADGATDKSGMRYNDKTGGELVSRLVVDEYLSNHLNGLDLVNIVNRKVNEIYEELGILEHMTNPLYRFTCGFICVRVFGNDLLVTYLGDLGFRINGTDAYQEKKQIDIDLSEERSRYIRETGDVEGSRNHIMPFLLQQFTHQNKDDDPLGYGVIDGTSTPSRFVKTFTYTKANIRTIELFSDGYFAIPPDATINAWETAFELVERKDPDKWKTYKSTKSKDDRTIAIITF